MSDASDKPIGEQLFILAAAFMLLAGVAGLWFCFDDWLAETCGVPGIGALSYWQAYSVLLFLNMVRVKRTTT